MNISRSPMNLRAQGARSANFVPPRSPPPASPDVPPRGQAADCFMPAKKGDPSLGRKQSTSTTNPRAVFEPHYLILILPADGDGGHDEDDNYESDGAISTEEKRTSLETRFASLDFGILFEMRRLVHTGRIPKGERAPQNRCGR
ncbi:Hypothetical protein NTJ_09474 [Nesidiocoris tenuis]|uniref:Uncharacterized protein n=1 Tax=Nesidiocoris tenuis TaxID=355587 RepID=A0ABN7B0D2_9HEMI|nr:Hypothetical protein NTJ_09474 [Nesidiocoris tenuis]